MADEIKLTENQQKEKHIIAHAGFWPNWPYCPVKRHKDGKTLVGFLQDRQSIGVDFDFNHESLRTVYLRNFFTQCDIPKPLKDLTNMKYDTVDAMILDGWQVD